MSGKQDYETPDELFKKLDDYYHFTLDAAADESNYKCERWIGEDTDALTVSGLEGEVIWCNPPYAKMAPWVKKFIEWTKHNRVVVLAQDKTDTNWFYDLFYHSRYISFLKGRVNFVGSTSINMHGAVVFEVSRYVEEKPMVRIWNWKKNIYASWPY